jgi:hypothetical protein
MLAGALPRAVESRPMARTLCRLFLVGLVVVPGAACTTLPKPAEMLTVGYRSPEQALRSFQLAVRADLSTLEYQCFSTRFRAEQHLSLMAWREVREQLWKKIGMRWAIANAQASAAAHVYGSHAEMEVVALGKHVHLRFLREDFGETWKGETKLSDDALDFSAHSGVQEGGWFYGQVPLPPGSEAASVTEMRLGREWKIDGIQFDDGNP